MPLSVVFLGAVYYIKMPEVRKAVDARTPIVHDFLGRFVQEPETQVVVVKAERDPALAGTPARVPIATPAPIVERSTEAEAPPGSSVTPVVPTPPRAVTDLPTIAADRTKWPKKVVLTKAATFPAVLNGKIVGTLVAPAGAEANVVQITNDKIGLEFNGGGAWVTVDQTDLFARLQRNVH